MNTSGPQTSQPPQEIMNLGYASSEDEEDKSYSNDSYSLHTPNTQGRFSNPMPSTSTDTGLGLSLKPTPKVNSPNNFYSWLSASESNSPSTRPQSSLDILQASMKAMDSPPDFRATTKPEEKSTIPKKLGQIFSPTSKDGRIGLFSKKLAEIKADEPKPNSSSASTEPELLKVSIPTATKSKKRKRLKHYTEEIDTTEEQKKEEERLEKLKTRQSNADYQNRAGYQAMPMPGYTSFPSMPMSMPIPPMPTSQMPEIYGDLFEQEPSTSTANDDDIEIVGEKPASPSSAKRSRMDGDDDDVVVLSSDDENDRATMGVPRFFNDDQLRRMRMEVMLKAKGLYQKPKEIKPRRNSNDYENSDLTPEGRLLVNAGKPEDDPDIYVAHHLTDVLKPHQLGGVRFMYDNIIESVQEFQSTPGFGCILAHSMGLGKTIQVITFVDIFFRATQSKKTLIICPVNTIQNWFSEFDKWLPKDGYDYSNKPIRDFDVFLLSDTVKGLKDRAKLIAEWHRQGGALIMGYEMFRILVRNKGLAKKKSTQKPGNLNRIPVFDSNQEDHIDDHEDMDEAELSENLHKGLVEALLDPGPDLVVCDEGHRIKNLNSHVSGALNSIKTKRRIVLTGTPLQNNLMEYYCMVNFVRPSYLGTKKDFSNIFEKPIRNGQCMDSTERDKKISEQRIHVLTEKLKGFVHRRSQQILKKILPESKEYVIPVRKSPIQHTLYRSFVLYAQQEMQAQNANFYNPLKAYAICVKILNHPDLLYKMVLKHREMYGNCSRSEDSNENTRDSFNSKTNSPPGLPTFGLGPSEPKMEQSYYNAQQQQPLPQPMQQSQMSTQQQNWGYQNPQNQYQDGYSNQFQQPPPPSNMKYIQNSGIIKYESEDGYFYNGQNGQNSNFQTPYQQPLANPYGPQPYPQNNGNGYGNGYHQTPSQQWPNNGQNMNNNYGQNGQNFNQPQIHPSQSVPEFGNWNRYDQKPGPSNGFEKPHLPESMSTSALTVRRGPKGRSGRKKQTLATILYGEEEDDDGAIKYEWAERVMTSYIPEIVENSYKLLLAIEIINETTRRGEKILFFSGSVMTLDVFESFLTSRYKLVTPNGEHNWEKNVNYCRFDGTTNATDREKYMHLFNNNKDVYLFLISTKAGSLGVNLVSATRVIIFDASWNPCHDAQAVCRIYRYGQQKKTYIYRLIVDNCMERAIFNRQISKQGLQQKVVDEKLVDANVASKELENLLCYDEQQDVLVGNPNPNRLIENVEDELLEEVIKKSPQWIAGEPFLHESMIVDSEKVLTDDEKRDAQAWYERERLGLNRFERDDIPAPRHHQPYHSMENGFQRPEPDFQPPQNLMDQLNRQMGRPIRPSPMPGSFNNMPGPAMNMHGNFRFSSPTKAEFLNSIANNTTKQMWDPNRPAFRLMPPRPKTHTSPLVSSDWIALPSAMYLPLASARQENEQPMYQSLQAGEEVIVIRNITTVPNKFLLKNRAGQMLDFSNDQEAQQVMRGILGPAFFQPLTFNKSTMPPILAPRPPAPPPIQPGEVIELD